MTKKLDLNKTVFELTQEYPELVDIMAELGFTEIKKKPMLYSVGKIMTIPKGAKMKNISMMDVVTALISNGFELIGEMPEMASIPKPQMNETEISDPSTDRKEQLKTYLKRLGDGEILEDVRADFVREFGEVEASEIMQAEQELMKEGTPLSEVQRLCDIHSALFHGMTTEEKIANAENEVEASLLRQNAQKELNKSNHSTENNYGNKNAKAAELEEITGHPIYTFTKENNALAKLLINFKEERDESLIPKIRELSIHYAKKGDLLYPLLKVKYGISGPSEVMWTVDDEIRNELGSLVRENNRGEEWNKRLDAVLTRAEEMIYKEQNILFPICAVNFTEEEWHAIYRDAKDYEDCLGVASETWEAAESALGNDVSSIKDGEVSMPGGHLTIEQLIALLDTIPVEITFVDNDNINRYFNDGPKVFKRPIMALNRDVFSCHPPKIEPMVRQILDDFRNGIRDFVDVWMEKGGRTMLVKYMAVRDKSGKYLGTLELVQDMEFAKEHFLVKEA
ncbi:histidine kinase [Clostridiales bacterium S5-A14a]|nr:histidine kinase [Clostridiales bacterium S5-A14a]